MSGVVLRCPQCGTTRSSPGECQACHEADVRYYCTNHAPGRWLTEAACAQCGARFGDPARPPGIPSAAGRSTPPRGVPPAAPRAGGDRPLDPPLRAGPTARRTVGPADDERRSPDSPYTPRRRPAPTGAGPRPARPMPPPARPRRAIDEPGAESRHPAPTSWRELLFAVARAQQRRAAESEARARARAADRPRTGGCLSRLLMLLVMFFLVLYMIGGGFLGIFMPW